MKTSIRILIRMLGMVIIASFCVSCTGDEPKSNNMGKPSTSTTDNEKPGSDFDNCEIDIKELTECSWLGRYYLEPRNNSQLIEVTFTMYDANTGSGIMIVEGHNGTYTTYIKRYKFIFEIIGNEIRGTKKTGDTSIVNIKFEYREGLLYIDAQDIVPAILGKGKEVQSDVNGILEDKSNLVYKVWLHENGLNILDFRLDTGHPARVMQLVESGSFLLNYNDYGDKKVYSYTQKSISFSRSKNDLAWKIIKLTEDKMILKGYHDNFESVYYAASPDIVPTEYGPPVVSNTPWGGGGTQAN